MRRDKRKKHERPSIDDDFVDREAALSGIVAYLAEYRDTEGARAEPNRRITEAAQQHGIKIDEILALVDAARRAGDLADVDHEVLTRQLRIALERRAAQADSPPESVPTQMVSPATDFAATQMVSPATDFAATQMISVAKPAEQPDMAELAYEQTQVALGSDRNDCDETDYGDETMRVESIGDESQPAVATPDASARTPDSRIAPGVILANRYALISKVASGGMGVVYKALDKRRDEAGSPVPWVAIKIVNSMRTDVANAHIALQREFTRLLDLIHANIVRVFDFDRHGDQFFIVMEWLEGETVARILRKKSASQPAPERAIEIIQGIACGLAFAHEQGTVHADIKPSNVFVTKQGGVKLLDFGIGRDSSDSDADKTESFWVTPSYASCEVLEGRPARQTDDVYALACIAYRLLSGERPFGSFDALEAEKYEYEVREIANISADRNRALKKALAFRSEFRTATAAMFLEEFDAPGYSSGGHHLRPEDSIYNASERPAEVTPAHEFVLLQNPQTAFADRLKMELDMPTALVDLDDVVDEGHTERVHIDAADALPEEFEEIGEFEDFEDIVELPEVAGAQHAQEPDYFEDLVDFEAQDELGMPGELGSRDELSIPGELGGRDELGMPGELGSRDELSIPDELGISDEMGGLAEFAHPQIDSRLESDNVIEFESISNDMDAEIGFDAELESQHVPGSKLATDGLSRPVFGSGATTAIGIAVTLVGLLLVSWFITRGPAEAPDLVAEVNQAPAVELAPPDRDFAGTPESPVHSPGPESTEPAETPAAEMTAAPESIAISDENASAPRTSTVARLSARSGAAWQIASDYFTSLRGRASANATRIVADVTQRIEQARADAARDRERDRQARIARAQIKNKPIRLSVTSISDAKETPATSSVRSADRPAQPESRVTSPPRLMAETPPPADARVTVTAESVEPKETVIETPAPPNWPQFDVTTRKYANSPALVRIATGRPTPLKSKPDPIAPVLESPAKRIVTLQVDVAKPELVGYVVPAYPQSARRRRMSGWTRVSFVITPSGRVRDVKIAESQPAGIFDRASLKAVSQWTYAPRKADLRHEARLVFETDG